MDQLRALPGFDTWIDYWDQGVCRPHRSPFSLNYSAARLPAGPLRDHRSCRPVGGRLPLQFSLRTVGEGGFEPSPQLQVSPLYPLSYSPWYCTGLTTYQHAEPSKLEPYRAPTVIISPDHIGLPEAVEPVPSGSSVTAAPLPLLCVPRQVSNLASPRAVHLSIGAGTVSTRFLLPLASFCHQPNIASSSVN